MTFEKIDLANWKRKETFEHYYQQQTSFSITTEIDLTKLKQALDQHGIKLYPALIFLLKEVVNSNSVFRTSFNQDGDLGIWKKLNPMYTLFNQTSETFSAIWTDSSTDFRQFHRNYQADVEQYGGSETLFPKKPIPENTVSISMIPWTSFTGFNLNINTNKNHLLPIITAGKFEMKDEALLLPLSLQVHHAVCDGYHASLFMNAVQERADNQSIGLCSS